MQKNFGSYSAQDLIEKFSSPLYVYQEKILREKCREIKQLAVVENFAIHYAVKANTNIAILKIIREEGLQVEVISPFEVDQVELAGFLKEDILFSSNNISRETFSWLLKRSFSLFRFSLSN